jgi:cob(I)alamin adenosyltransferase
MKIYTKRGDGGQTGLLDGSRVAKDHLRVAAYGDIDELGAVLGIARTRARKGKLSSLLHELQRDLFALGAQLADPKARVGTRKSKAAVTPQHVERLERAIDEREKRMPTLKAFLLSGGSPLASVLHLARTVCRRAERTIIALAREEKVDPLVLAYVNRLSDLLFVLARYENLRRGQHEERW